MPGWNVWMVIFACHTGRAWVAFCALLCKRVLLGVGAQALYFVRDITGFNPCVLEVFVCRVGRQALYYELNCDILSRSAGGIVSHSHSCANGFLACDIFVQHCILG